MKLLVVHYVVIFQTHLNLCQQAIKFSLNLSLIVIQLTEDLGSNMMCLVSLNFQNSTVYVVQSNLVIRNGQIRNNLVLRNFLMITNHIISHSALCQAVTTVSPKVQFFKVESASLNSTPKFFGPMVQWLALWTAMRQNESTNPCRGTLFDFIFDAWPIFSCEACI